MLKIKLGKKLLALALVAAMLGTTGCGSKKDDSAASKDVTKAAGVTEAADSADTKTAEKTKISVYRNCFNITQGDTAEVKKVQDAINAYIADKGNVEIELTEVGSAEYKDKGNLALANKEIDLVWTANWLETIGCKFLVAQNAAYDLTELLPKSAIYKALPEWVWTASAFGGKNYFIPCYKESAEGYNLMFRKDLVDKFGWDLSTVKSLKDIEPMLKDCKAEGLKYPYLTQKTAMFYRYYLDKFDFLNGDSFMAVDKDADTVVNTLATPEYKEFTTLMGDWAEKGYLSEDDLTKTTTDTTTQTQDWGVSFWTDVPDNTEAGRRYKQDVELVKITDNYIMSNTTIGSCFAVSATSSEQEANACLEFLNLLYTDKTVADLFTFGIEGTDYNVEEGKVVKTDAGLYNHSAWESTSVEILSLEKGEPDNKVELYKTFNDSAKTAISAGFRFDTTDVAASYTACQQVFQEFGFALENGGYAPADIDGAIADYQKALDDAGYQDVLKACQTQYEEWKKVR